MLLDDFYLHYEDELIGVSVKNCMWYGMAEGDVSAISNPLAAFQAFDDFFRFGSVRDCEKVLYTDVYRYPKQHLLDYLKSHV